MCLNSLSSVCVFEFCLSSVNPLQFSLSRRDLLSGDVHLEQYAIISITGLILLRDVNACSYS